VLAHYVEQGRGVLILLNDKFGDYGTIGTMIFDEVEGVVVLKELAISCRALGKGVEECIITFIDRHFSERNEVRFVAKRTYKNEAFFNKLLDSGFYYDEESTEMKMKLSGVREYPAWFKVNENVPTRSARLK
jgi:predicted enzyme involved in methoxymalonyl-ACP biosynthesis